AFVEPALVHAREAMAGPGGDFLVPHRAEQFVLFGRPSLERYVPRRAFDAKLSSAGADSLKATVKLLDQLPIRGSAEQGILGVCPRIARLQRGVVNPQLVAARRNRSRPAAY